MFRKGRREVDNPVRTEPEPVRAEPTSIAGSYLLAFLVGNSADREGSKLRYAEFGGFPTDQEVVAEYVFSRLLRELVDVPADDRLITALATPIVASIRGDNGVEQQDVEGLIRVGLGQGEGPVRVEPLDRFRIYRGVAKASLGRLGLPPLQIARLVVEGEQSAAERGIWLAPIEADDASASTPSALFTAPEDPDAARSVNRVDLGSLVLGLPSNGELRITRRADGVIEKVDVVIGAVSLEFMVFSAPDGPLWPEIREELRAGLVAANGTARERSGPWGTELWAQLGESGPSGELEVRHLRFAARQGPGWMLRGLFHWTGRPAERDVAQLETVFQQAVVVAGPDSPPAREKLPLRGPISES
jgi:hypothetical protein